MKKILIIDDDHDLADTIKSVLEYAGYSVILSHEGKSGIENARDQMPDLILLDILMPGLDGTGAMSILKADPITKDIPVIFLTGLVSGQEESSDSEINVGGVYIKSIGKPFDNEKLLETVKSSLE